MQNDPEIIDSAEIREWWEIKPNLVPESFTELQQKQTMQLKGRLILYHMNIYSGKYFI